jgi:hypothetical protein
MVTESSANVLLFADSGWLVSFFRRVKPPPLSRLSLLSFLVACQPANCTWPRLRGHIQRPGSSSIAMDNTHHIITATSNVGSTLRLPCFHHPGVSAVGRLMVGMASACDDRSSQHPVRAAELNMPRNCPRMRVGGTTKNYASATRSPSERIPAFDGIQRLQNWLSANVEAVAPHPLNFADPD